MSNNITSEKKKMHQKRCNDSVLTSNRFLIPLNSFSCFPTDIDSTSVENNTKEKKQYDEMNNKG